MNDLIVVPKAVITADSKGSILFNKAVEISDGRIKRFIDKESVTEHRSRKIFSFPDYIMIPGFVQSHVHLCQSLFRGMAEDLELLDWLKRRIFPLEAAHDAESLRSSAKLGLHELMTNGTTSILDMGTLNHQATVFEELAYSGMRGFSGKCMMDRNSLYPKFKESTQDSIRSSIELADAFHDTCGGRIKYGFAPRFVLSCSEELLTSVNEILNSYPGGIFHTHSSENRDEIEAVRKLHGKENIEYFASIKVLGERTVLAHCIHLNRNEIDLLKESGSHVAHCPSSNMKLGSGIAPIPKYLSEGISVSLGADGAPCNNNLSPFMEMRLAGLIQKPLHGAGSMSAETLFRLATINGAKTLGLENEIGSIEIGKYADLVLLDLHTKNSTTGFSPDSIYADIIYSASSANVKEVMIGGEWIIRNGISSKYDGEEIVKKADEALQKLLKRF